MSGQKRAVDITYALVQAYKKKEEPSKILEMYKSIENKEAEDEYKPGKTFLHTAAAYADSEAVKYLIEQGLKPNAKDDLSRTPLHYLAADETEIFEGLNPEHVSKTAQALLDGKASALLRDTNWDETCYHIAAKRGNLAFIDTLIKNKVKLDMTNRDGQNILHMLTNHPARSAAHSIKYASKEEDKKKHEAMLEKIFCLAKALLDYGLDPAAAADCAVKHELHKLAVLLQGEYDPADIFANDKIAAGGKTLHQACETGDAQAVKALIKLGADKNEVYTDDYSNDMTALAIALMHMKTDCAAALLEAGADPNFRTGENERTALFYFLRSGNCDNDEAKEKIPEKILKLLFEYKLDANGLIDNEENTGLIYACLPGSGERRIKEAVRQILLGMAECDVNKANKKGVTALMNIVREDYYNIENDLIMLLERGADPAAKDSAGNTALMYAASNNNKAAAKAVADLMFSFGDSLPKAVNNEGKSAIDFAVEKNNEALVNYLLAKI